MMMKVSEKWKSFNAFLLTSNLMLSDADDDDDDDDGKKSLNKRLFSRLNFN